VKMFDADKTRVIWLPYGGKTMTICQAVSIQYRNVTDKRTDEQTDRQTDLLYQYRASVCRSAIKMDDAAISYASLKTRTSLVIAVNRIFRIARPIFGD